MERQEKINIIKQHISNIIKEEQKYYQKIPEFFIYDIKDFFEDSTLRRLNDRYKLIRNNNFIKKILSYSGYIEIPKYILYSTSNAYTGNKKITILLKEKDLKQDFNEQLYFRIVSVFHEFRHIGQDEKFNITNIKESITSFEDFRYLLENFCLRYLPPSYTFAHDDFYFEIDANLYAIEKADEYCRKNNVYADKIQRKYKQKQYSKMLTYDFDYFIDIHRFIALNPIIFNQISKNPTYSLFFKKNGTFNKLSDITRNPLFYSLDDKLKMEIFTSRSFLSSINYNLNDIESNYLIEMIDNKISDLVNNYNKNRDYYVEKVFSNNIFIKNSFILLSKMDWLLTLKNQHTKTEDNKDLFNIEFEQQIQTIRNACDLNNTNNLIYSEKQDMNRQLNTIISKLNNYFNNNRLQDTQKLLTVVKTLKEAMKAKIDIGTMPIDAHYEQISNDYENKKIK